MLKKSRENCINSHFIAFILSKGTIIIVIQSESVQQREFATRATQ